MSSARTCPRDYVCGDACQDEARPFSVYVLYCPALRRIVYVGQTERPLYYRLRMHRSDASVHGFSAKQQWIRALRTVGLLPFIRCVARFATRAEAKAHESNLITSIGARRKLYNLEGTPADRRLAGKRFKENFFYGILPAAVQARYASL